VAGRAGLSRAALAASGDPLPFRSPTTPKLPGYIAIEASVPCAAPFDDRDWLFSVDWDGARALLFLDPGGAVRIQGEMPGDLARRFPDVAAPAAVRGGRGAVLDGVITVLDPDGRPDLAGFGRRLAAGPAAAHELPAVYLGSDLLHLDGRSTLGWPLDRRLDALGDLTGQSDALQVPDHVRGRGEALAAAAMGRGLAALLARRAGAPYRPGVASPDRLRIALTDQTTCVVAGVVSRRRGGTRLILGEHVAGRLTFAGHVDGPNDRLVAGWLAQRVADLTVSGAPLDGVQPVTATWLRPALTATVRHQGRSSAGSLLRPALLAVRDDVDPRWCVQRPAVAGPIELHAGTRFSPTLLMPLPLGDGAALPQATR
jgi:bifunctional non-homologous end joining protein LigD